MKTKFNQDFLDKLITGDQRKRFLLLYSYLKNCILSSLRSNRFREANSFDWDDLCSQVYHDIFILCSSNKWVNYHPNQVKRFLFVVVTNSMLRHLKIIHKHREKNVLIDDYENVLFNEENEVSIIDIIEGTGQEIEKQLVRIYQRLLGKETINEKYKIILGRYARVIAEEIISESSGYRVTFSVSCETKKYEVVSSVASCSI